MSKNLRGRTAAIVAVLVIFCYGIFGIPHGVTPAALKASMLERIKLGLDLKGGTRLVLLVHVQDAVVSTTDHDVEHLQEDLAKSPMASAGIQVHKLDPAHPEQITIANIPPANVSAVRTLVEGLTLREVILK
jgi:preprotein translocase subunit SecD